MLGKSYITYFLSYSILKFREVYYTAQYCTYFSIVLYFIVLYCTVRVCLQYCTDSLWIVPTASSLSFEPFGWPSAVCVLYVLFNCNVLYCTNISTVLAYLLYVHLYCNICTCPGWRFTECKLPWWSSMLIGHGSLSLSYLWAMCTIEEMTCVAIWSIELYRQNEMENEM